jgi:hypothetical protein
MKWRIIMATTIVRVYDHFSDAEKARNELIMSGFAPASVHLDPRLDEAGPVEGNFVLDYKDTEKGPRSDLFESALGGEEGTGKPNDANAAWRGAYVLTVDVDDGDQQRRAAELMERFGGRDIMNLRPAGRAPNARL